MQLLLGMNGLQFVIDTIRAGGCSEDRALRYSVARCLNGYGRVKFLASTIMYAAQARETRSFGQYNGLPLMRPSPKQAAAYKPHGSRTTSHRR